MAETHNFCFLLLCIQAKAQTWYDKFNKIIRDPKSFQILSSPLLYEAFICMLSNMARAPAIISTFQPVESRKSSRHVHVNISCIYH